MKPPFSYGVSFGFPLNPIKTPVDFQHPTHRMRLGITGRGPVGHPPTALHQALQVRKPRHRQADAVLGHGEMIPRSSMVYLPT